LKSPVKPMPWDETLRNGDAARRDEFLESHIDLVKYLALRIASRLPSSVDVEDLVHDGVIGLLDAFSKYDGGRGVRFRTYAESRVRGAILDGLRRKDWRPRSVRLMQRDLEATVGMISSVQGRLATEEEIAGAMGLDMKTYRELLQDLNVGPILSLEDLPAGNDPMAVAGVPNPDACLEKRELIEALADELRKLPDRERQVLELYYHEELNMREIGAVLGVTESRVCQLHAQAAARLRDGLRARLRATGAGRSAPIRKTGGGRR